MGYEFWSKEEKERQIDYWKDYIRDLERELNSINPSESEWLLKDKIKEAERDIERLR
ncbi:MAG: hypothetical protein ACRCX2_03810 [Paraclostridium sp.]